MFVGLIALSATASAAVVFPEDSAFTALPCADDAGALSFDPVADEADALLSRDIVGDAAAPAAFAVWTESHLFLRMRLDEDPFPSNEPLAGAWAFQLDLDDDRSDYEIMVLIDGFAGQVEVYENTTTTLPNDRQDPPDDPPADTLFLSEVQTTIVASGFGGTDDAFLDVAVPTVLTERLGMSATLYPTWVVTSGAGTALDGDVACGGGGGGTVTGTTTTTDEGTDSGGIVLEGGGGCQTGPAGAEWGLLALLLGGAARRARQAAAAA